MKIVFTWTSNSQKGNDLFSWLWKDENNSKINEGNESASSFNQSSPRSNNNSEQTHPPSS